MSRDTVENQGNCRGSGDTVEGQTQGTLPSIRGYTAEYHGIQLRIKDTDKYERIQDKRILPSIRG